MASLGTAVRAWPTPTAQSAKHGAPTEWENASGRNGMWIAAAKAWPTPAAADNRDRGGPSMPCIRRRIEMGKQIGLTMAVDGKLNPDWVEMLMGFPPGWTDTDGPPLRDLSTPESLPGPDPASQTTEGGCTPLETPSCRSAAR
jgi:hypothetical protein